METVITENRSDLSGRALLIHQRLNQHFYPPFIHPNDRLGPLSQLIHALVAQGVPEDAVADRAFRGLCAACWTWREVRDAPVRAIHRRIAEVDPFGQKAMLINRALVTVSDWSGWKQPSLEFLGDYGNAEAIHWLAQLDGVERHMAASVLLFSTMRRAVLPVDTHLRRVSERAGIAPEGLSSGAIHAALQSQLPRDWKADDIERYYLLVRNIGRRYCTLRAPRCPTCPMRDLCAYGRSRTNKNQEERTNAVHAF